ncbi:MAG: extracellular solute-binding protein [Selenomonadaceae bacterium]|nr:extracellular solute-binding protein [Selenomonadaceae bacterium]
MQRYTILLLTSFLMILSAIAGSALLAGADQPKNNIPHQQLTVYTTLPPEHAAIISEAYEETNNVRLNFVPLAPHELMQRLKNDFVSDPTVITTSDVVLADTSVLNEAANMNFFKPYLSEINDAVKPTFKQENGSWTGVWYDPIIFCINRDYLNTINGDIPNSWIELANYKDVRLGITDFLAAEASANLMFQMIGQFGDVETYKILSEIHPKVIQYAKYLSNPVRQAGMGEVDISIAVESEALRYMQNGYPLKIIYPTEGTAYLLTGVGISTVDESKIKSAEQFADWLLSDDAQRVLQANGFYFLPTNPQTLAHKKFAGKNLTLFDHRQNFTPEQKYQFLDRWVKQIRLGGVQ